LQSLYPAKNLFKVLCQAFFQESRVPLYKSFAIGYPITMKKEGTQMPSPKDTHGPVIKTGPTSGQNRSRNQNGQWRKKRSDAGKTRK